MPGVPDPKTLSKIPLFQGLPDEELARINNVLRRATYPAGTNLFTVEQPGEVAYIILSGTIKLHVEQPDGSDVIVAILGAGELVGEMSLIDSFGRSATGVTLEESTLVWLDRATFREYLETMPTISLNLLRIFARRIRLANAKNQALASQDVFGRVARQLLAFATEYGQPGLNGSVTIPFRLTQSDLASLVGASRVRVNRALVHYQDRRYISVDQHQRITVHDQDALAQRCQ